ncbi:MAG: DsbA family protein [Candidatus Aenigmarchaeota archaeon]|nr:DsbA family protein [Candidatus Aenigmarchaeota archaeon]
MKINFWMISTIVCVVAIAILSIVAVNFNNSGIGEKAAGDKMLSFIEKQKLGNATIISSVKEGSLYKVVLNYQGQKIPIYLTLDGNYFITQIISTNGSSEQSSSQTDNIQIANISIGNSPYIGNENAKVIVIEFADFSCPFCAAASGYNSQMTDYMKQNNPQWEPIVNNLMKDYVETGKVLFVSKYLYGHSGGHPAQIVAWCLNEQNLYWDFYPKAFENQADVEDLSKMKTLAQELGTNTTELDSCIVSGRYDEQFDQEQNEGLSTGVSGTPAFFINGKIIDGAVPYSQIKSAIDVELNK